MPLLEEVTGQSSLIAHVIARQRCNRKEATIVFGAPGCGVSWSLTKAGMEWEQHGGIALKATGAAIGPSRPLLPWLTMFSPSRSSLARWDILRKGVVEASKAIPVIGDVAKYFANEILNRRRRKIARQAQMLDEKEQDLLFVIETAAQKKRLLLTIDHISTWDDQSWNLLQLMASSLLHDFYPSLTNAFILIGASEELLPRCRSLLQKIPTQELELNRLKREQLSIATTSFGFPKFKPVEYNLLYEATGGRLDLLHDLAGIWHNAPETTPIVEANTLYGKMIERRIASLRGDLVALERLLSCGSFLGYRFSPEEASCLAGYTAGELTETLRIAERENLLKAAEGIISFPSLAMQQYFWSSRIGDPATYHQKFAQCLRQLRPGDYRARCEHHLLAGEETDGLVYYCLARLDARRRRLPPPPVEGVRGLERWSEFDSYLTVMLKAYDACDRNAIEESLESLDSIENLLPRPLIAERDCLGAQACLKSHRISDFERAVTLLVAWLELAREEGEIWSRIARTLMIAFIETSRHDEARKIEEMLTKYYAARAQLDPWALYGLNCLRRSSECVHRLVPAQNRLRNAVAFFGPDSAETIPRHPLQYYYTLNNLVSNLIASGSFFEASVRASDLRTII